MKKVTLQKACYIYKKWFSTDDNNKNYHKIRDHCHYTGKYRGVAHDICNLRYKTPKEIPVVFHNDSTYNYHFVIKELAKGFEGQFECLGENTEKYVTFSVPIKKELKNGKTITYKIKLIDSFRFMSSSLPSLVDNLSEGFHNSKCKECDSYCDFMEVKDEKLHFKCFDCRKKYKKAFNKKSVKNLIKTFPNTYDYCSRDINKFILLLRKGVYPYGFMDSWERFNKELLPDKYFFMVV